MKGDSDVEVRPEDQTRINEFGRTMCAVCRAHPRGPPRSRFALEARMHELRRTRGLSKGALAKRRGSPSAARARARRATIERWRRRARRGLVASLGWTPRSHALHPAQKLEELTTRRQRRARDRAVGVPARRTPKPLRAQLMMGAATPPASRRRGAFRALRTPSLASFPPVSFPAIPPRVASWSNRTIRAVFHRRDRGVWHRVLRGATNEDASRARGGARIPSRETNARASA